MEMRRPHELVPVESAAEANRRGLEFVPRRELKAVRTMTVAQRAAWLKKRKAKRRATRKARRANRSSHD